MLQFIISRAKEPSTFAGLAGLAAAVGISQPIYSAVTAVIVAVAGALAIFLGEKAA